MTFFSMRLTRPVTSPRSNRGAATPPGSSPATANVVVNAGGATASDVRALMTEMHRAVADRFGVDLVLNGHEHNYQRSHPVRSEVG